jgi:hypothetical protein
MPEEHLKLAHDRFPPNFSVLLISLKVRTGVSAGVTEVQCQYALPAPVYFTSANDFGSLFTAWFMQREGKAACRSSSNVLRGDIHSVSHVDTASNTRAMKEKIWTVERREYCSTLPASPVLFCNKP